MSISMKQIIAHPCFCTRPSWTVSNACACVGTLSNESSPHILRVTRTRACEHACMRACVHACWGIWASAEAGRTNNHGSNGVGAVAMDPAAVLSQFFDACVEDGELLSADCVCVCACALRVRLTLLSYCFMLQPGSFCAAVCASV